MNIIIPILRSKKIDLEPLEAIEVFFDIWFWNLSLILTDKSSLSIVIKLEKNSNESLIYYNIYWNEYELSNFSSIEDVISLLEDEWIDLNTLIFNK